MEVELRIVLATEGERVVSNTLEEREGFTRLACSGDMDLPEGCEVRIAVSGNLEPLPSTSNQLVFRPFQENRLNIGLRRKEVSSLAAGKVEIFTEDDDIVFAKHLVLKI